MSGRGRDSAWFVAALAGLAFVAGDTAADEPTRPVTRLTHTYWPKFGLTFSPDGSHLVYARHHNNRRAANKVLVGLRIVRADGRGDRPLLPEFEHLVQLQEHPAWSPDGKRLLLTGGGNDLGNFHKDTFVCEVGPDFKCSGLRKVIPGTGIMMGEQPAWSPDGKEIVVATFTHALLLFGADGKDKRLLFQSAGQYCFHPAWSPDGEWIAFSSDRDGDPEIYKIRSDGTELTRLTRSPGVDCRPKWSPDGRWIVFTSNRGGNDDLYLMSADGGPARNLTRHPALDDYAAWAPDGRSLAFVSMRDGGFDIYRMPLPADVRVGRRPPPAKPPAEDPGGLVAHYDFDEDTGDVVRDRQTGRKTLQLAGGARWVGGPGRGALAFDGRDSYANAGNPRALQLAGPLTVSCWVRPEPNAGNGYLVSKHGWSVYLGPDLRPYFETRTANDQGWDTLAAGDRLAPGVWSFVAAVFDVEGRALRLHVNGKPPAGKPRTDGKLGGTGAYPLELGKYVGSRSQWFHGQLDEVRVYRRALGADELAREFRTQARLVKPGP